ncbi:MAG TPA: pyridoxal 5'-phosphate synthase glutaminase subunit PdxT [Candidatus Polarisedimenticolaceae bacterium]|nr:pyridoxal 5'-phosphate synthase glutaminase subunit PdxT [Candidatus Polarisedimenticolaceae bacterium]
MRRIVGILALQGDFAEHASAVERSGARAKLIKTAAELATIDALIIPGGESTTMGIVAKSTGLVKPLQQFVASGLPVWGTCAGLILLANQAEGQKKDGQTLLGGLDITASRNFFGRQIQSFSASLSAPKITPQPITVMFIRAPGITRVGPQVEVLANQSYDGHDIPVAVRQGNILATSFHTELDINPKFHNYFLSFN